MLLKQDHHRQRITDKDGIDTSLVYTELQPLRLGFEVAWKSEQNPGPPWMVFYGNLVNPAISATAGEKENPRLPIGGQATKATISRIAASRMQQGR